MVLERFGIWGAKRTLKTSYDGADGLAGPTVSNLVYMGRTVDSNVESRRDTAQCG